MHTPFFAYEQGYRAAVAGHPCKVPSSVRKPLPSMSEDWFRGYDEALRHTAAERAQMLMEFKAQEQSLATRQLSAPGVG